MGGLGEFIKFLLVFLYFCGEIGMEFFLEVFLCFVKGCFECFLCFMFDIANGAFFE